jgi:hypothetical protein
LLFPLGLGLDGGGLGDAFPAAHLRKMGLLVIVLAILEVNEGLLVLLSLLEDIL